MSEVTSSSVSLNITQMSELLHVSRDVLSRMCRDICIAPRGNNRLKTFTGLERSRLLAYKEAEQDGKVNVTTGMLISDFNQTKFAKTLTALGIEPQKVTKSAAKWISIADLKRVIAEGNKNFKHQSLGSLMEPEENLERMLPRYSVEGAASELSISASEIESIRADKIVGEIGYHLRDGMPVMYSDQCLDLIREYKNSLKNSQAERMENKQMSDAVHESLTEIFQNYMNPKFDSLKKRLTDLESLVEGKFENADSAGSKKLKEMTVSLDKLDERMIDLNTMLTQVLEWATDPNNLMNLIEASGKGNLIANEILSESLKPKNQLHYAQEDLPIGEPWHSVSDATPTPLPHSESLEDFDSSYRKHGPETLRFNNTLSHDECKKALDAYHVWVKQKMLPSDPKDRGLKDLSNHVMNRIRGHFKKRNSGMTLTELANEVKATQLNWKQSSQVQGWLKRAALGLLSISRDLEIVPVPSMNGGRPTTFLYHKDDWASVVRTGNNSSSLN